MPGKTELREPTLSLESRAGSTMPSEARRGMVSLVTATKTADSAKSTPVISAATGSHHPACSKSKTGGGTSYNHASPDAPSAKEEPASTRRTVPGPLDRQGRQEQPHLIACTHRSTTQQPSTSNPAAHSQKSSRRERQAQAQRRSACRERSGARLGAVGWSEGLRVPGRRDDRPRPGMQPCRPRAGRSAPGEGAATALATGRWRGCRAGAPRLPW